MQTANLESLRRAVGTYLGWGASNWPSEQLAAMDDIITRGMRKAYYPVDPRNQRAVRWHFLQPQMKLATEIGQADYDLQPEVEQVMGPMTYTSSSLGTIPVELTSEPAIRKRRMFQADDYTGRPTLAAVEQVPPSGSIGTRYRLLLWPAPDDVYELQFTASLRPQPLTSQNQIPPGGERFSGLLLAAVLAQAESEYNDGQQMKKQEFVEELIVAIAHEAAMDPEKIIQDECQSDEIAWHSDRRFRPRSGDVTFINWGQ